MTLTWTSFVAAITVALVASGRAQDQQQTQRKGQMPAAEYSVDSQVVGDLTITKTPQQKQPR